MKAENMQACSKCGCKNRGRDIQIWIARLVIHFRLTVEKFSPILYMKRELYKKSWLKHPPGLPDHDWQCLPLYLEDKSEKEKQTTEHKDR
jgi:hypothetical protein